MKSLVCFLIVACASWAQAGVISKQIVTLPVNLSPEGIKLSIRGYSAYTVKILVPELAAVTVMNHRNDQEGAPCLATTGTYDVEDIVQGRPTVEQIPFTVLLEKNAKVVKRNIYDSDGKYTGEEEVCVMSLQETVTGEVRGFKFSHVRGSALPERVVDDCK
jgi:hypothetical protein